MGSGPQGQIQKTKTDQAFIMIPAKTLWALEKEPCAATPDRTPSLTTNWSHRSFHRFPSFPVFLFGQMLIVSLLWGCGAVGKPIPPEDVGIEAKIQKQEREAKAEQEAQSAQPTDEPIPVTEQPEELPPFYPIGVR